MQAILGRQKGGNGPRRSLRKARKLGMRVRQLVLSSARSWATLKAGTVEWRNGGMAEWRNGGK